MSNLTSVFGFAGFRNGILSVSDKAVLNTFFLGLDRAPVPTDECEVRVVW